MQVILSFLFCLLISPFLVADDVYETVIQSKETDITKEEIVEGNYYSLGDVSIEGKIQGSAYIVGTQVEISGEITKNLIVIGGSVTLTGTIGGNVHIVAGQAIVQGDILGNVTFVGANLLLTETGKIRGNLFIISGNVDLGDTVSGDVITIAASFTVSGTIEKNLRTFVDRLRLASTARILGNITYRSRNLVMKDPGAEVLGKIYYRHTPLKDIEDTHFLGSVQVGAHTAHFIVKFFYTFIIGLLLLYGFPKKLQGALHALHFHLGESFMFGLVMLMGLPILTGILLITVLGAPFALTLLALNIISFYTVTVFPILWLTNKLFQTFGWKENTVKTLAVGQSLYYGLTSIPVIGVIIACLAVTLGFGAALIAQRARR